MLVLAGCADTPEVVGVSAQAGERVSLGPAQSEGFPEGDVAYRWELVLRPETSQAIAPEGQAAVTFLPDVRGPYVVERWLAYGLSDRLTHEFVIQASGIAPEAAASGSTSVAVGTSAVVDGGQSHSPEGLPLTYQWRLAERPRDSAAMVSDPHAASTSFVADVAGTYVVELAVFDGDMWSDPHATLAVTAQ